MKAINAATSFNQFLTVQNAFRVISTLNLTSYLYPEQAVVSDGDTFDFIVVGAGTAGCVVATRLAQMDRSNQVLLIEAGDDPPVETTIARLIVYPFKSAIEWNLRTTYESSEQCNMPNKTFNLNIGKVLGGTSSKSYLVYAIGSKYDYDKWAIAVNDSAWSWEGVFPYFKKSQRIDDATILASKDKDAFGHDGPIVITKDQLTVTQDFLEAFREQDYPIRTSINGNCTHGYAPLLLFIGEKVRQSSAFSYLSKMKCDNLKVLKNALVTEVIIDCNKTATGVRVLVDNKPIVINARKEVIISAGAIFTPAILMRSGIGPKSDLLSKGLPVIADLEVGKNLIDHVSVLVVHDLLKQTENRVPRDIYLLPEAAIAGYVGRTKRDDEPIYQTYSFISLPSHFMDFCVATYDYDNCDCFFNKPNTNAMFWTAVVNLHPLSRGEVTLSSKNICDPPIVKPGYFKNKTDLHNHAKYVRKFRNIENTKFFKKIDAQIVDPKLKMCKNLKYGSQEYYECYVLAMMATQRHFSGTCAMGPHGKGVVDTRMRVHGINRLRVVDASVIPVTISGDIQAPVIMLAEKFADIIKEEYYCYEEN